MNPSSLGRGGSRTPSFIARLLEGSGSSTEGGALVEMAVVLPLLMVVMTGIFSFSIALYQKLQLAEAVGNAGRLLAVDRGAVDPCQDATNAIYAAAPGLQQGNLTITYSLDGANYGSGVTSCPGASGTANANMVQGQTATVVATYPTSISIYGASLGSFNLATQVTEVIQ